jgi:HAD superfamily hydrolase (TIGR01509 family)
MDSICALGNRKNELFNASVDRGEVQVYPTTVALVRELRASGVRLGIASSSKNAGRVLQVTGLGSLFDTVVDGVVSAKLGLRGKPEPDIFLEACEYLGAHPEATAIVEDAVPGVHAGYRGRFGLVIGVAREANELQLQESGADLVVADLGDLRLADLDAWFAVGLERNQWQLRADGYDRGLEGTREVIFTIGNGYVGTRAALEETPASTWNYPGTYIAGLYNRLESTVHGTTVVNEDMVNCPNWLPLTFRYNSQEWFDPNHANLLEFSRVLDFRAGTLSRTLVVEDAEGRRTRVESVRAASMADPHRVGISYSVTPLNYAGQVSVRASLDGRVQNKGVQRYRQLASQHLEPVTQGGEGSASHLAVTTTQSRLAIGLASKLVVSRGLTSHQPTFSIEQEVGLVHSTFEVHLDPGQTLRVEKLVSIYTSQDRGIDDPLAAARAAVSKMNRFEDMQRESAQAWGAIWKRMDIRVGGDRYAQKLLRFNLYHCLVAASPHTARVDAGVPARGLHGEAYRGHVFWDECFILPLYNLHYPEVTRASLLYRYHRLDAARTYARQHGYEGAMFPWQSGSDGREETQVIHLNPLTGEWGADYSALQRHVSLAIARNIWDYWSVTRDRDFLETYGLELLLEICRFWASLATLDPEDGRYDLEGVMGPDEYHEKYPGSESGGLRNNAYTNLLVAWLFARMEDVLDVLGSMGRDRLEGTLNLSEAERSRWGDIRRRIRIPLSQGGLLEQFEGFFELEELDWAAYRGEYGDIARMDRILKAEGLSPDSYQVAKQADALMAFYALGVPGVEACLRNAGYPVPEHLLEHNFAYYYPRTSHGSTLSALVHARLALELGQDALWWPLYMQALESDYLDIQGGTTKEGVHLGVMGGSVLMALRGLAGVGWRGDRLELRPRLPRTWRWMHFRIRYHGDSYRVKVTHDEVSVCLESSDRVRVGLNIEGTLVELSAGEEVTQARSQ